MRRMLTLLALSVIVSLTVSAVVTFLVRTDALTAIREILGRGPDDMPPEEVTA